MLTITYNNNEIPLDEGFSVRLSWINPVCFFDKIMGDAGLGIDIPVNDYSKAIFGHPDRFEKLRATAEGRKFENVEIRYDGAICVAFRLCGERRCDTLSIRTILFYRKSGSGNVGKTEGGE